MKSGGNKKWESGSALPQNKIPTAIVVHRTIANQLILFNRGIADSPPILYLPKGEKKTAIVSKVIVNDTQLKPSEKLVNILCCIFLMKSINTSGKIMLLNTARIRSINGGQNTQGRTLNLKNAVFFAMEWVRYRNLEFFKNRIETLLKYDSYDQ